MAADFITSSIGGGGFTAYEERGSRSASVKIVKVTSMELSCYAKVKRETPIRVNPRRVSWHEKLPVWIQNGTTGAT